MTERQGVIAINIGSLASQPEDGGDDLPKPERATILIEETAEIEHRRRLLEQKGVGKFGAVTPREKPVEDQAALEEGLSNEGPLQHPFLGSQRYDGIEPNLNPEPAIGTAARREFDNQRRNQEMEKQHRLGNMPTLSRNNTPEPKPG